MNLSWLRCLTLKAKVTDNDLYLSHSIFLVMMAGTLLQKEVRMKGVATLGYRSARALGDPVRVRILEILSHRQMTTEEVAKILVRSSHKKATTTIRHHLETLKNAGLIEIAKMVEVRGAVMKYYMSTVRAFSYDAPGVEKHLKLIDDTSFKLLKVLKGVLEDKKFAASFGRKNSCRLCNADHYKEYVALEILNAALARTLERKEFAEMLAGREHRLKE
jgi:DNA-binding transcriptional ArsR family regulator